MARAAVSCIVDDVVEYASREYKDVLQEILEITTAGVRGPYSEQEKEKALLDNNAFLAPCLMEIAVTDYSLKRGETILDRYLREKGLPKNPTACRFVESWRIKGLSLYEVMNVEYRKSFTVLDVMQSKELKVSESGLSEVIQVGEAFFGRIVPVDDLHLMGLAFLPTQPADLDWFPEACRGLREETHGSRTLTWDRYFSKHWDVIPGYWLRSVLQENRGPEIVNTDGDPVEPLRIRFRLRKGTAGRVAENLRRVPGISEMDELRFMLHMKPGERSITPLDNVLIASMKLKDDELSVDVNSCARAARMEALLGEILGDWILEAVRETIEEDTDDSEDQEEAQIIPEEEKAEMIRAFLDRHYRSWLDTPIPALKNLTPREASHDPRMRPRLLRLLREMENLPTTLQSGYDLSWIRKELLLV